MSESKPFKTEDCVGCVSVDWSWANNEKGFCSGLIKNPNPEEDILRFCFVSKNKATAVDLTFDEALTISGILATCAAKYMRKLKSES